MFGPKGQYLGQVDEMAESMCSREMTDPIDSQPLSPSETSTATTTEKMDDMPGVLLTRELKTRVGRHRCADTGNVSLRRPGFRGSKASGSVGSVPKFRRRSARPSCGAVTNRGQGRHRRHRVAPQTLTEAPTTPTDSKPRRSPTRPVSQDHLDPGIQQLLERPSSAQPIFEPLF